MAKIVGIYGSLRANSYNKALIHAAQGCAPKGCLIEAVSLNNIPMYNQDVEDAQGIPQPVAELKDLIMKADGILLSSPEYNHGIPGVTKNAIDWLSRPPEDIPKVFGNRPIGIIGASPSGFGTAFAQTAWLPVFKHLNLRPYFGHNLHVRLAHKVFDENNQLIDDHVRKNLTAFLQGFVEFLTV